MATRSTGSASLSFLNTCGSSASAGRRFATRATAPRTSLAAWSMSRPSTKVTRTRLSPSSELESITSTPETPAMAPSITSVIWLSTTSGAAPV